MKSGDIIRTPYEPSGLVKVVAIAPVCWPYGVTVLVRYLHDHAGYTQGSLGRYRLADLEERQQKDKQREDESEDTGNSHQQ